MKKFLLVLFTRLISEFMFAQSADVITDILESEEASVGQVAYLCAVQQHLISDNESYDAAVSALISKGDLEEDADADSSVSLAKVAKLFARNWSIQGGIMFTLTNGSKRYAFKQLVSDGVISSLAEPSASLSGGELLSIYSTCVSKYDDFDIKSVSMEAE